MKVSIAVVQFHIAHLQPEKNFIRIENFIKKAKRQKAQVIIFPEDCVTGSIFGNRDRLDATGAYRKRFAILAKKYAIDIISGSSMERTPQGAFNTSYYINAHGKILGKYQKNNLYLSEHKFLTPGKKITVFDTAYGRAAIVICWDLLFPKLFEHLKKAGVEIVYCPSYWYYEIAQAGLRLNKQAEATHIDALCVARAVENNIAFVYANAAGKMVYKLGESDTLVGHSQIAVPFYGALKKINTNQECMFIKTVDLSILKLADKVYKLNPKK